jgi:hypothetical protein
LFDLLGVTHFLHAPTLDRREWMWERNDRAMPRAYLVPGPVLVPEGHGADALAAEVQSLHRLARLDPRRNVLLHGDVTSSLRAAGITPKASLEAFRSVPVAERTANRIAVEVHLDRPGILVLNEPFFPGWRAHDGGVAVPILRANVLFRSVALSPGRHRVTFEFRPVSWVVGWWISACAAVAAGCLIAFHIQLRRGLSAPGSGPITGLPSTAAE